jgi:hypothetical protein
MMAESQSITTTHKIQPKKEQEASQKLKDKA